MHHSPTRIAGAALATALLIAAPGLATAANAEQAQASGHAAQILRHVGEQLRADRAALGTDASPVEPTLLELAEALQSIGLDVPYSALGTDRAKGVAGALASSHGPAYVATP